MSILNKYKVDTLGKKVCLIGLGNMFPLAQKTAKGITKILPPFYTHNEDGTYTAKAECILRGGQGYFD